MEMTEMSLACQFPDDLCQLINIHNQNRLRSDLKLENLVLYLCLSLLSLSLWST